MDEESVKVDVSGNIDPQLDAQDEKTLITFLRSPFTNSLPDPKTWITDQRQHVRPWIIFLQTANFKFPSSLPRLSKRIMRNIEYFQANYVFIFLGLIIYCLITSPLVLFAMGGTFYLGYKLSKRHLESKFIIFGKELTLAQQYGLLAACSLPVYYLVGAHAAMFWVLGASLTVITLHATFYNIDALVQEEDEFNMLQQV